MRFNVYRRGWADSHLFEQGILPERGMAMFTFIGYIVLQIVYSLCDLKVWIIENCWSPDNERIDKCKSEALVERDEIYSLIERLEKTRQIMLLRRFADWVCLQRLTIAFYLENRQTERELLFYDICYLYGIKQM